MPQRDYSIDFIRCIAILFITNSHFQPLYYFYPALGTLGVHGNALFFFITGYVLTLGKSVSDGFLDWYKKRIARIWPTIIVWTILSSLLFQKNITWKDFLLAPNYWFIQCIMIYYIILYYLNKTNPKNLISVFTGSILLLLWIVLSTPKADGSIYHGYHFFCYFPSMILGLYCGKRHPATKYPIAKTIVCFIAYFLIMTIGKGKNNALYYTQLIAIIPLNLFTYYMFTCKNTWDKRISFPFIRPIIFTLSSLSLEIYIVQFSLITEKYNDYFPLSILIVAVSIITMSYCLKILTNFFVQIISKEHLSFQNLLKL